MADSKLQELNAITTPQDSDLLYVVRNEDGTYTDNKITKADLVGSVSVPTKVSELENDSGFISQTPLQYKGSWEIGIDYKLNDIVKVEIEANAGQLSSFICLADHTSTLENEPFAHGDGIWAYLTPDGLPTVAYTGDYADLTNTPTIPTDLSDLTDTTGVIPDDISANVLLLDNTTEFTPDADYEPATKKYVDDNAGGVVADRITQHYSFSDYAPTNTIWKQTLTNSSCVVEELGLKCTVGGTVDDRLRLALVLKEPKIFDRNPMISISFRNLNQYNTPMMMSIGSANIYQETQSYKKRIGWRWTQDRGLYASNGDGSTEKETLLDTTFGSNVLRELTVKLTSGEKVEYYVDGVLKATHTQNLPSGDANIDIFCLDVWRNNSNSSVDFWIADLVISFDAVIPT